MKSATKGEQPWAFMGDSALAATCASLAQRIDALRPAKHRYEQRMDEARIGPSLEHILDSIENLVLPVDARAAFELLVSLIERDGDAMDCCGDHHNTVAAAVNRAIFLVVKAGQALPDEEVRPTLERLISEDVFDTREMLIELMGKLA